MFCLSCLATKTLRRFSKPVFLRSPSLNILVTLKRSVHSRVLLVVCDVDAWSFPSDCGINVRITQKQQCKDTLRPCCPRFWGHRHDYIIRLHSEFVPTGWISGFSGATACKRLRTCKHDVSVLLFARPRGYEKK